MPPTGEQALGSAKMRQLSHKVFLAGEPSQAGAEIVGILRGGGLEGPAVDRTGAIRCAPQVQDETRSGVPRVRRP